jgi:hypothetical protein
VDDSGVRIAATATTGALFGDYNNQIDILSVQYTHIF